MKLICTYCHKPAELVGGERIYPHRPDLADKKFWLCAPCDAYVGCHAAGVWVPDMGPDKVTSDGTLPMGRLANAELRAAKRAAHDAFDPTWKTFSVWKRHPAFTPDAKYDNARRKALYRWLAKAMSIPEAQCHIGMFDVEECKRVIELMNPAAKPKESNAPRSRSRLHIDKLNDYVEFCKREGWTRAPIKGDYEVLRMTHPGYAGPLLVYQRLDAKVHLTTYGHSAELLDKYFAHVRDPSDARAAPVHQAASEPSRRVAEPAPNPSGELVTPPWA